MNSQPQTDSPAIENLPKDMTELYHAIAGLPESHRIPVMSSFDRVVQSTHRRQRILGLVQEALGQLRLDMKYLLFDLEATRRERDELRRAGDEEQGL